MCEWHQVEQGELTTVLSWLESHLPESWKIYATIRETIAGRWQGQPLFTLGWPTIRGVVEGKPQSDHPCPDHVKSEQMLSLFAPNVQDVETILRNPLYFDWTRTLIPFCVSDEVASLVETIAKAEGFRNIKRYPAFVLMALPGDITPRPVPPNFKIRKLNFKIDLDFMVSTWRFSRQYANQYFKALALHQPNVCVADSDNRCVSFELGTEYGTMGMLHTEEAYRGQGLGKVVISHLAQEYFHNNLPAVTFVDLNNELSLNLHLSLGFKNTHARSNMMICEK